MPKGSGKCVLNRLWCEWAQKRKTETKKKEVSLNKIIKYWRGCILMGNGFCDNSGWECKIPYGQEQWRGHK